MNWKKVSSLLIIPFFLLVVLSSVLAAGKAAEVARPGVSDAGSPGLSENRAGSERVGYGSGWDDLAQTEKLDPNSMFAPGSPAYMPPFPDENLLRQMYSSRSPANVQAWTGEVLADPQAIFGFPLDDQRSPAVAFDGTNYLVVWEDLRSGSSDLYAARVTPTGAVLDSAGLVITVASGNQSNPKLVFDGTNYFLAWEDTRNGSPDVYGARVTPSGTVLDVDGFPIDTRNSIKDEIALCYGGGAYLVAWSDSRMGDRDIYGRWVRPSGVVLGDSAMVIFRQSGDQENPSIAFNSSAFFVVWQDLRADSVSADIYGARILPEDQPLDTRGILISVGPGEQLRPSIAANGLDFMVAWQDTRDNPIEINALDIYGSIFRISMSADTLAYSARDSLLSPDKSKPKNPRYQSAARVLPMGTGFFVGWEEQMADTLDIFGTRVTLQGNVLDVALAVATGRSAQMSLACTPGQTDFFMVWQDYKSSYSDIYGTRMNSSGTLLDASALLISMVGNDQWAPAIGVTTDGSQALLVWEDRRNATTPDIYGVRVSQDGTIRDPRAVKINGGAQTQATPAVAFDGTNYLAVWSDFVSTTNWDIKGTLVDMAGVVSSPTGTTMHQLDSNHHLAPAAAFGDTAYLVVWEQRNGTTGVYDLYGVHVRKNLARVEAISFIVNASYSEQHAPQIAFGATNYLVVWEDRRFGVYDIYCTVVGSRGSVPDTAGKIISDAVGSQAFPSLAFDGAKFLVAWEDYRSGGTSDIYASKVDTTGRIIGSAIAICTAPGSQRLPKVIYDGTNFLVVWQDSRGGANQVYGARIDTSGTVLDVDGTILSYGQPEAFQPVIGKGGSGQLYTAWSSFVPVTCNSYRTWLEVGTWPEIVPVSSPLFSASPGHGKVVLSWKKRDDVTACRIYRKGPDETDRVLLTELRGDCLAVSSSVSDKHENEFEDSSVTDGVMYSYWLGQLERSGHEVLFGPIEARALPAFGGVPMLSSSYPNPFGSEAVFVLYLPLKATAAIQAFDVRGTLVREIFQGTLGSGTHTLRWDGKDGKGKDLPSGIYFVRFKSGKYSLTKRAVLIR
ncbi:MAG: T9SS type A sorting domain-containing protein [Candidatus Eisenbacteria bacterium]|nr:T9SS type A sorting domain-containing protein [Candidatus Eisenbacteria bacterium]